MRSRSAGVASLAACVALVFAACTNNYGVFEESLGNGDGSTTDGTILESGPGHDGTSQQDSASSDAVVDDSPSGDVATTDAPADGPSGHDGATDAASDATGDAPIDAPVDAPKDGSNDAAGDAAKDAPNDAPKDAPSDAASCTNASTCSGGCCDPVAHTCVADGEDCTAKGAKQFVCNSTMCMRCGVPPFLCCAGDQCTTGSCSASGYCK
jgi:hypothetical protein